MSYILTLVASSMPLSIAHLEFVEKYVEEKAIGLNGKPVWLDAHKAADMPVQNAVTMEQMIELRRIFAADLIDVLCSKVEGRKKRLILCDMDATIVTTETLDELAARAGLKDQIAAITARAMNGELDFHEALRMRVALLKNLPVTALHETLAETELCEGADKLIHHMRESGATCVLVSGGFTFFTSAIADRVGFHHNHGSILDVENEVLVGTVGGFILDKEAKLSFLHKYADELGLDLSQTVAVGDGANDLPMVTSAGLGIGYRPKPVLERALLNILKYADLTGVLYAQGFKNLS